MIFIRFPTTLLYLGNGSTFTDNKVETLGKKYLLHVFFTNNGPSKIRNAILSISIPSYSMETGEYFYYYPVSLVSYTLIQQFIIVLQFSTSDKIICNTTSLNPNNYTLQSQTYQKRQISAKEFDLVL